MDANAVSWPTVTAAALVSAGVSGFVTLGADYFARPGMEARKERLLDRYRARREFGTFLMRIQIAASAMRPEPPDEFTPEQQALFE